MAREEAIREAPVPVPGELVPDNRWFAPLGLLVCATDVHNSILVTIFSTF